MMWAWADLPSEPLFGILVMHGVRAGRHWVAKHEEKETVLVPVGAALSFAGVCRGWQASAANGVAGLLVQPIALRYVFRGRTYAPPADEQERVERATQYRGARLEATAQALVWCLHRFPALRALALVGWSDAVQHVGYRVSLEFVLPFPVREGCWRRPEDAWPRIGDFLAKAVGDLCPRLTTLRGCRFSEKVSPQALRHLATACPELRELNLDHLRHASSVVKSPSFSGAVSALSSARALDLSFSRCFDDASLALVAGKCPCLEALSLSHTSVSSKGVDVLCGDALPRLHSLSVDGLKLSRPALHVLLQSELGARLRSLSLYGLDVGADTLALLARRCAELADLGLEHDDDVGNYSGSDLSEMLEAMSQRLVSFRAGHVFSDLAAAALGKCRSLRLFHIANVSAECFDDAGLTAILSGCPRLECLGVAYCEGLSLYAQRWADGPPRFAQLLADQGASLRRLEVTGCSCRALKLLKRRLPGLLLDHAGFEAGSFEYEDAGSCDFEGSDGSDGSLAEYGARSEGGSDDSLSLSEGFLRA